ncbi:aminoglycoside phosphotransferase family protein [Paenibacillus daejeonensis]|uniref:aminoglycoside phosphotransferase family protein n=1 Tax=Paenibacillus daejeonensis TaxID=135193 RepID=UPI0003AADC38|nr:aminoglycoside phosphotransferase family protein [Paenibacillus daejeonensis]
MVINDHLKLSDLEEYLRRVFGSDYKLSTVSNMHGGAQKVVYKVKCTNGFSCVLYVWDASRSYFQEDMANQLNEERSYGSDLFQANNTYLTQQGIQTPAIYDLNTDRDQYPFDYALVEYVSGPNLEVLLRESDPKMHNLLLERVGELLANMHGIRREVYGKLNAPLFRFPECHLLQVKNAEIQLAYAAQFIEEIRNYKSMLLDTLYRLEANLRPRTDYGWIHGELGPDHILINEKLEPYLIDIEGAMFFDLEHEHSFLEMRFGEDYRYLKREDLDAARMHFYRFHHHISLLSGGLKLLHRGFPDQQFAKGLADYHCDCVLRYIVQ